MTLFEGFRIGQRVWSFTVDVETSEVKVEGECVVLEVIDRVAGRYLVSFGSNTEPCERYLQEEGQDDPQGWADHCNDPMEGDHHAF